MWAAYRRDALGDVIKGLSAEQFRKHALDYADLMKRSQSDLWIINREIPIGIVGVHFDGRIAFPHVSWFPEATSRDKIQAGVLFLHDLKKDYLVIITGPEKFEGYWRHLAKYGLLRPVGKIRDFYGPGDHAMMFQSVRKNGR